MFTWPTPLKYPKSMSKYIEPTAEEYLDMDNNLGFLRCNWALKYLYGPCCLEVGGVLLSYLIGLCLAFFKFFTPGQIFSKEIYAASSAPYLILSCRRQWNSEHVLILNRIERNIWYYRQVVENPISEQKVSVICFILNSPTFTAIFCLLRPRGETANKYCGTCFWFFPQLLKNKSFRAFAVGLELLHGGQKIRLRDEVLSKEVPTFECHNTKSCVASNVWELLYCN